MYQWIYFNLTGKTLIVCVVIMLIAANVLRDRSTWVKAYGISIGLVFACILGLDGFRSSDLRFIPFLEKDWYRLLFVVAIARGLASMAIRAAEVIYRTYQYVVGWNRYHVEMRRRAVQQARHNAEQERISESIRREQEAKRPDREQRAAENLERRKEENAKTAADALRRANARKDCQLVYHRHAAKISESLSFERFSDYINQYMSESASVDAVEKCGKDMQELILSFFETKPTREKSTYNSLTDLVADYQNRRSEIERLPIDEIDRSAQLAHLAREESRAIRKFNSK